MRIPFDIKFRPQIESGEYKVENRDGDIVTILEWDIFIHGMAHMILIRYNEKYEFVNYNGRVNRTGQDCNLDLFIVTPEPELTEFEDRVKQLMGSYPTVTKENKGSLNYEVRKVAAELLDLAREEIMDEWSKGLHDTQNRSGKAYNDGYNLGFEIGYKQGKVEVFKDLPKWRISKAMRSTLPITMYGNNGMILYKDGYEISISDLEKLQKED